MTINRKFFSYLSAALLLFSPANARTAEKTGAETDTVKIYYLQEVVVYGKKNPFTPSMISEIAMKEIKSRAGINVADILRMDTGLSITTGAKAETATRIRGFTPNSVLVLVDGRPINPGYYGKADLSMLPKNQIAKIKVIKGPASVAYGANAMGGVINIVTEDGSGRPETLFDSEFDQSGQRNISLARSGRLMNKLDYWLFGYDNASEGFYLSEKFSPTRLEDGGRRENSAFRKSGFSAKLGYDPSPGQRYVLSGVYHRAKKDVPWSVYSDQAQFRRFPRWERYGLSIAGSWNKGDILKLKAIVFADAYHDQFQDYSDIPLTDENLNYDSKLENWTLGTWMDAAWQIHPKHHLHTGLNFRRDLMNKKPDLADPWVTHIHITGSFFAEERFNPVPEIQFTAGISGHVFHNQSREETSWPITPMVSASWKAPGQIQIYASWAQAVRFPTMHQLYSQSSGNPDLNPEKAEKIEAGLSRPFRFKLFGEWYGLAEAAVFHNALEDLVYREWRTHRFQNISEAGLTGMEIRISGQWTHRIAYHFSYGYIDASATSREMMREVPEHQWAGQISAELPFAFNIMYEYAWFDKRTTASEGLYLNPYRVHNLTLGRSFGERVKIYLRGMNLADTDYQEEPGYPAPGRTVSAGFSIRY